MHIHYYAYIGCVKACLVSACKRRFTRALSPFLSRVQGRPEPGFQVPKPNTLYEEFSWRTVKIPSHAGHFASVLSRDSEFSSKCRQEQKKVSAASGAERRQVER